MVDYTFEDWMNGKPEPGFAYWATRQIQQGKADPVSSEIIKAKKFTFDTALEYSLSTLKDYFFESISGLSESKTKLYIQKTIEESEEHFKNYDIRKLITQSHSGKFKGIDGKKYLEVKATYEDLKSGECFGSVICLNDFFFAVLHFEKTEFLNSDFSKLSEQGIKEKKQKINETIPVRYKLLNEFFQENEEFKKLKIADQEKLLGFILGCHKDTAKHIKNQWFKYSRTKCPDGKDITQDSIDRYLDLSDKLKKGKML